ncbi:MAG TPA: hypothetical protein VGJ30_14950 [Candidatus Angelobacter sp.]|jgi:hypothetical protein
MKSFAQMPKSEDVGCVLLASSYLAHKKATKVGMEEFLAGLYLGCFEHLLVYFTNWGSLVRFASQCCGLKYPAWHYWTDISQQMRSDSDDVLVLFGVDVQKLLEEAGDIAMRCPHPPESQMVALEHLLGAISANQQFEICKQFVQSGLDLQMVQAKFSGTE